MVENKFVKVCPELKAWQDHRHRPIILKYLDIKLLIYMYPFADHRRREKILYV